MRNDHRRRALAGQPPAGGNRPFGWNDDRVTLHPVEAPILRKAAEEFAAGRSINSIVAQWQREGLKATYGRNRFARSEHAASSDRSRTGRPAKLSQIPKRSIPIEGTPQEIALRSPTMGLMSRMQEWAERADQKLFERWKANTTSLYWSLALAMPMTRPTPQAIISAHKDFFTAARKRTDRLLPRDWPYRYMAEVNGLSIWLVCDLAEKYGYDREEFMKL